MIGQLEHSGTRRMGARKGTAGVAEKLALEQVLRYRGTINRHKGAFRPQAGIVNGARG